MSDTISLDGSSPRTLLADKSELSKACSCLERIDSHMHSLSGGEVDSFSLLISFLDILFEHNDPELNLHSPSDEDVEGVLDFAIESLDLFFARHEQSLLSLLDLLNDSLEIDVFGRVIVLHDVI